MHEMLSTNTVTVLLKMVDKTEESAQDFQD